MCPKKVLTAVSELSRSEIKIDTISTAFFMHFQMDELSFVLYNCFQPVAQPSTQLGLTQPHLDNYRDPFITIFQDAQNHVSTLRPASPGLLCQIMNKTPELVREYRPKELELFYVEQRGFLKSRKYPHSIGHTGLQQISGGCSLRY